MCRDVVNGLSSLGLNSGMVGVGLKKYVIIQKYLYACNKGNNVENLES
jgi:hypothetical protein